MEMQVSSYRDQILVLKEKNLSLERRVALEEGPREGSLEQNLGEKSEKKMREERIPQT